jgi:hypothetical protein
LIWRPVYKCVQTSDKLQELDIPKRNRVFWITGCALILLSLGLVEWIEAAVKLADKL